MGIQCPFTHWHIEQTTTILLASREAKLNFTKRKIKAYTQLCRQRDP
jgi:hypothetical protein